MKPFKVPGVETRLLQHNDTVYKFRIQCACQDGVLAVPQQQIQKELEQVVRAVLYMRDPRYNPGPIKTRNCLVRFHRKPWYISVADKHGFKRHGKELKANSHCTILDVLIRGTSETEVGGGSNGNCVTMPSEKSNRPRKNKMSVADKRTPDDDIELPSISRPSKKTIQPHTKTSTQRQQQVGKDNTAVERLAPVQGEVDHQSTVRNENSSVAVYPNTRSKAKAYRFKSKAKSAEMPGKTSIRSQILSERLKKVKEYRSKKSRSEASLRPSVQSREKVILKNRALSSRNSRGKVNERDVAYFGRWKTKEKAHRKLTGNPLKNRNSEGPASSRHPGSAKIKNRFSLRNRCNSSRDSSTKSDKLETRSVKLRIKKHPLSKNKAHITRAVSLTTDSMRNKADAFSVSSHVKHKLSDKSNRNVALERQRSLNHVEVQENRMQNSSVIKHKGTRVQLQPPPGRSSPRKSKSTPAVLSDTDSMYNLRSSSRRMRPDRHIIEVEELQEDMKLQQLARSDPVPVPDLSKTDNQGNASRKSFLKNVMDAFVTPVKRMIQGDGQ
ncbi:uncharacterized protein LOC106167629 [Lingula anatina]|uniref:Uncharacterized protein LOC106167629 n=1 Tax=Lingula anatina TaxID=7574 RepID=A0A1S3IVD4_LINAN|nr:uncharacterized protein LOC106167629 [Lingula anatina]|eukprot:XP_013401921.1 uncharacterized protein LOC106167629 [Lingula anatina]